MNRRDHDRAIDLRRAKKTARARRAVDVSSAADGRRMTEAITDAQGRWRGEDVGY
ncbi:hypothetical protein P0D88_31520 [Paraburkholderia sp. RL18-103-BIB-C]|uniref:hypothetical protein n=1 Tax=Paraburkholderia sp. RL18-103-BIB-C TaxID=3031637 RepID=UPI0038B8A16F